MMLPSIELQDRGEGFYFIANYHSYDDGFRRGGAPSPHVGRRADFLACGLDPKKATFWKQSTCRK
jgi:tryptophanyl-tRNA synthetase